MIRHVAVFTWNNTATPERVAELETELAQFRDKFPVLLGYSFGTDLGLVEGNADFTIIADLETESDWRAYLADPEHTRVVTTHLAPLVQSRLALQVTD